MSKKLGRPTLFNKALADRICARIADGETLRAMCRNDETLPERSTISLWIATREDFADQVARAREAAAHVLVEENLEIADDGTNDWMEKHGRDSVGWQINGEAIQRSKLRVEERWRQAESILPKVYARTQRIEHSGSIGLVHSTDEELVAEMMELVATGRLKLPGNVQLEEAGDEPEGEEDDYSDIA